MGECRALFLWSSVLVLQERYVRDCKLSSILAAAVDASLWLMSVYSCRAIRGDRAAFRLS